MRPSSPRTSSPTVPPSATYTVTALGLSVDDDGDDNWYVRFSGLTGTVAKTALTGLTMNVGSTAYVIADATASGNLLTWTSSLGWTSDNKPSTVSVSLTLGPPVAPGPAEAQTPAEEPVQIHALSPPNEVREDTPIGSVPFTVYLPRAVSYPVSVDYATADGVVSTQWEPRWQEGGLAREPCPHQSEEDIKANGRNCLDGWFRITSQPATAPADYTAKSGRVTLAPGETRKIVRVNLVDDTVEDGGENFRFVLSNPSAGAELAPHYTTATVLILNDEADLEALSVEGAPDAGGPWAKLDLGTFAAETTEYAVTVPHGTTHARLKATAVEDGATLKLHGPGGTAVERGSAIALAAGENALVVKVSLPSGARKTYTVTVTRQAAAPRPGLGVALRPPRTRWARARPSRCGRRWQRRWRRR